MANNDENHVSEFGGESEISALGITILDQSTLERNVEQKVDAVLAHHEHQQKLNILGREFKQVSADIEKAHKSAEQLDRKLETLQYRITDPKRYTAAQQEAAQRWSDVDELNLRLQKIRAELADITDASDQSGPSTLKSSQVQETERERLIRLGEITPFAPESSLQNESTAQGRQQPSNSLLVNEQSSSPILARLLKRKKLCSNLDKLESSSDIAQEKRKKTKFYHENLPEAATSSSTCEISEFFDAETADIASDDECSEYLPSDASLSSEELATGNDDWEPDHAKTKKIKVGDKRKKTSTKAVKKGKSKNDVKAIKRSVDDSDYELYRKRLKKWKKTEEASSLEDGDTLNYEVLGRCMKVPKLIWSRLYKYQRTGVQWLWQLHSQGCGGILGDEMGLGKTVQIIAFLAGLQCGGDPSQGPVLIVCPATLLHQWVKHFHLWWPPFRVAVLHHSGGHTGSSGVLMHSIAKDKGVLITSYTGVRGHLDSLLRHDWQYVILDEGHKIRNPDAQITLAVKNFYTPHRLILSGSPIQNSLKELWSLFDFVFPGKLGTLQVFLQQFAVPITHGGFANASRVEVETGYQCAVVLRDTISPYLLRRMKADVKAHLELPEKSEQVLFCALTKEQRSLYQEYLAGDQLSRIMSGKMKVFVGLTNLRKLCNHPDLYSGGIRLCQGETEDDIPRFNTFGWWERSGKMQVVHGVLKVWHKQGHRVLLFTQSSQMLSILEKFVRQQDYSYLKMTGATAVGGRQQLVERYNKDSSIFVFLLTTRVGGLGVNLTGADRVLIYDPDWNPSTDTQARERAWRIGQLNNVTIYRLLTAGTIEEKIYHRQIFKQFLTNRVLKDPKQQRFFKTNDLFELFSLNEGEEEKTESSALFAGLNSDIVPSSTSRQPKRNSSGAKKVDSKASKNKKRLNSNSLVKAKEKSLSHESSNMIVTLEPERRNSSDSLKNQSKYSDIEETSEPPRSSNDLAPVNGCEKLPTSNSNDLHINGQGKFCSNSGKIMDSSDQNINSITSASGADSGAHEQNHICESSREATFDHPSIIPTDKSSDEITNRSSENKMETNVTANVLNDTTDTVNENGENLSRPHDSQAFSCKNSEKKAEPNSPMKPSTPADLRSDDFETESKIESSEEEAKRKKMRMLAKMLSKQIGKKSETKTVGVENSATEPSTKSLKGKYMDECNNDGTEKGNHKKGRKFEGERISYLVKKRKVKVKSEDKAEETKAQDDYVLSKLFKNSGVHTALSHDAIVNANDPDYLLLQSEADRVAKEAMKALRASRAQCRPPLREHQKQRRPRFGINTEESEDIPMFNDTSTSKKAFGLGSSSLENDGEMMSSSQLLQRMRDRSSRMRPKEPNSESDSDDNPEVAAPFNATNSNVDPIAAANLDLLSDIRNFVAFQAEVDGRASTSEIISKFRERLPKEKTHIFKALLKEICDFRKESGREGMWYIKPEFQ